ncbi:response regulator [Spirosoma sp. HMF4905]|uniref:Response regulator n=1 Tax=Spirosoma arboris TaxID=2682092 RepID=A0A7K1SNG0_9BACT|nr:TIR domain-containing protein [Spirosoma arboris]MVM35297.1 response regulator [Spirosoma arboris]
MKILWVDDDLLNIQPVIEFLEDNRHEVTATSSINESLTLIKNNHFDIVLLDLMMPDIENTLERNNISGAYTTGKDLARQMKKTVPSIKIVCCSISNDEKSTKWFIDYCNGFINKLELSLTTKLLKKLENIVNDVKQCNIFIVHGYDSTLLFELKNFLQNNLKLPEPVILREQPSLGKTIIEKFEHYSEDIDIIFVLMTPDDEVVNSSGVNIRRARQNVVFELGYFYGKLQRKSGKIIILHKGTLDLPSDIYGVIFLQIDNSFESVTEQIRNELRGII